MRNSRDWVDIAVGVVALLYALSVRIRLGTKYAATWAEAGLAIALIVAAVILLPIVFGAA